MRWRVLIKGVGGGDKGLENATTGCQREIGGDQGALEGVRSRKQEKSLMTWRSRGGSRNLREEMGGDRWFVLSRD